jgi:hypothetical protein
MMGVTERFWSETMTKASITLFGRHFQMEADGNPETVLGGQFSSWEGSKEILLLAAYETLKAGELFEADFDYEIWYDKGTLVCKVTGSLEAVEWDNIPQWTVLENDGEEATILVLNDCRYCVHLKDVNAGDGDFMAMCELKGSPSTCKAWKPMDGITFAKTEPDK